MWNQIKKTSELLKNLPVMQSDAKHQARGKTQQHIKAAECRIRSVCVKSTYVPSVCGKSCSPSKGHHLCSLTASTGQPVGTGHLKNVRKDSRVRKM